MTGLWHISVAQLQARNRTVNKKRCKKYKYRGKGLRSKKFPLFLFFQNPCLSLTTELTPVRILAHTDSAVRLEAIGEAADELPGGAAQRRVRPLHHGGRGRRRIRDKNAQNLIL